MLLATALEPARRSARPTSRDFDTKDPVALAPSSHVNGARTVTTPSDDTSTPSQSASYGDEEIYQLAKYTKDGRIDPEIRTSPGRAPAVTMMPTGPLPPPDPAGALAGPSVSPRGASALHGGDAAADVRKSKRELSQSKRAAQNRAAQVSLSARASSSSGFALLSGQCRRDSVSCRQKLVTPLCCAMVPVAAWLIIKF
jgi:hypothetical protein